MTVPTTTTPRKTEAECIEATKAIIERVALGGLLVDAAAAEGLSLTTFRKYLDRERELALSYARAKELRADLLVDEALAIVDNPNLDAHRARNQYQFRQWMASKLNAKVYGDRLDLNVAQTISIKEALAAAHARVRPICDLDDVCDVEVVENTGTSSDAVSDTGTETPALTAQVAAIQQPGTAEQPVAAPQSIPDGDPPSAPSGAYEPDIFT
jgi:hypothetical protein